MFASLLLAAAALFAAPAAWDYDQDPAVVEYGFARAATLIDTARSEARNHLLVDNGDLIQGSPPGDVVARVRPPAAVPRVLLVHDEGNGFATYEIAP